MPLGQTRLVYEQREGTFGGLRSESARPPALV